VRRRNPDETRRRLVGATVASLFERGYGGLSTVDVARRARISRGGQLHHFPDKQSLLAETVAHLFEMRLAELRAQIDRLEPAAPEQRLAAFIDASWPAFKSRSFYAWLELLVASRTEPLLRDARRQVIARFRGARTELFESALRDSIGERSIDLETLSVLVFGNMEAIAINRIAAGAGREDTSRIVARLEALKTASGLFLRHLINQAEAAAQN
jgi:AcrR family transcriptional regulator